MYDLIANKLKKAWSQPEIVFFHEFHKPPFGGGNQFLLALKKYLEKKNLHIGSNKVKSSTKICLFNSFNFNFDYLTKAAHEYRPFFIHRVDGPIGSYRGSDDGTDEKIWKINNDIADVTIFQSEYSLKKHVELGYNFKNPVIIYNAVDPDIFHSRGRIGHADNMRKVRIIASSWSDNPKKGGPIYKWLEENLDWDKYEFTFVGRTKQKFEKIRMIDACPSERLADILRSHDIYIAASQNDPCSNALLEALSCGLPVAYLNSGGHPEIVKKAGIAFNNNSEALLAIDSIAEDYALYQNNIDVVSMESVANKYYGLMIEHI